MSQTRYHDPDWLDLLHLHPTGHHLAAILAPISRTYCARPFSSALRLRSGNGSTRPGWLLAPYLAILSSSVAVFTCRLPDTTYDPPVDLDHSVSSSYKKLTYLSVPASLRKIDLIGRGLQLDLHQKDLSYSFACSTTIPDTVLLSRLTSIEPRRGSKTSISHANTSTH